MVLARFLLAGDGLRWLPFGCRLLWGWSGVNVERHLPMAPALTGHDRHEFSAARLKALNELANGVRLLPSNLS